MVFSRVDWWLDVKCLGWMSKENMMTGGLVEFVIFTAIIYWLLNSSVGMMVDVMCGRAAAGARWLYGGGGGDDDPMGANALRRVQAQRLRRRDRDRVAKEDAERQVREHSLYRLKDGTAPLPRAEPPQRAPLGLACQKCTPLSRESWGADQEAQSRQRGSAVVNILDVGRRSADGLFSRYFCDLLQASSVRKWEYVQVAPVVMSDERLQRAIDLTTDEEIFRLDENRNTHSDQRQRSEIDQTTMRKNVEKRAKLILENMKSTLSDFLLRLTSWLLHKLLPRIAPGGASARLAAIERVRQAASTGVPLVLVPLHRSHLDYILVSLVLLNSDVRPPLVAAGDNLRIPFFGWLLRGLGAFYIRRRVEGPGVARDHVYRAALRAYLLKSLEARHNLEFFIEGGRTRTGKPQMPKAGILSVLIDAYLEHSIEDALLVPVSMNYERLVDGNFVREQLGVPKQMETFWSALMGIWQVLRSNYGGIRVDFSQPYSLKELITSFQKQGAIKTLPTDLCPAFQVSQSIVTRCPVKTTRVSSNSSFLGSDVTEEHKAMVEAIARHLVYDASQATAIMSTNLLAHILLYGRRGGGSEVLLCADAEALVRDLRSQGRHLGFSGNMQHVLEHAVDILGPNLVRRENGPNGLQIRLQPTIEAAIELSYYANCLLPHYVTQAIVATAIETLVHKTAKTQTDTEKPQIWHSDLMETSLQLCGLLSREILPCAPCTLLEDAMSTALDHMLYKEILVREEKFGGIQEQEWSRRFARKFETETDDIDNEGQKVADTKYRVGTQTDSVRERRRLVGCLSPLLSAYGATAAWVGQAAFSPPARENEVLAIILRDMRRSYDAGKLVYGEALSTDAIKNCLQILKQWGVVDISNDNRNRLVEVNMHYKEINSLEPVCSYISKFNIQSH